MENKLTSLKNTLIRYKTKEFVFIEPGGNHGDQLIYEGMFKLANENQITFQSQTFDTIQSENFSKDKIYYIHGGGGYNKYNSGKSFKLLELLTKQKGIIVIQGPCSIDTDGEVAQKLIDIFSNATCEAIMFFVREKTSQNYIEKNVPFEGFELGLDVDTAFHLNKEYIESKYGQTTNRYALDIIRKDGESTTYMPHRSNSVILDPAYYATSFKHWYRLHAHAESILSNRTHSAILGAILGKKVFFYNGVYHKNRSIWEYTLKEMGVVWAGKETNLFTDKPNQSFIQSLIPSKVKKSYKVNRIINHLKGVPNQ